MHMYVYQFFSIRSSADGRLGRVHISAIGSSAAVDPGIHTSFQIRVSDFSGPTPGGGLAGSRGSLVSVWNVAQ